MATTENMATTKNMANYIATTRQRDKETAKGEVVWGAQWFQKKIYEANILQNATEEYCLSPKAEEKC